MIPHVSIYKLAGQWWWEITTYDDRLMTPDRFIDEGNQDTWRGAMAEASHTWAEHVRTWL